MYYLAPEEARLLLSNDFLWTSILSVVAYFNY